MQNVSDVTQQVEALRQKLHDLMQNKNYADAEIITASATLDTQLEEYAQMLQEKRMPTIRSF